MRLITAAVFAVLVLPLSAPAAAALTAECVDIEHGVPVYSSRAAAHACADASAACAETDIIYASHRACALGTSVDEDGVHVDSACASSFAFAVGRVCAAGVEAGAGSVAASRACVLGGLGFFFWGALNDVCVDGVSADAHGVSVAGACYTLFYGLTAYETWLACAAPLGMSGEGVAPTCVTAGRAWPAAPPLVSACVLA